MSVTRNAAPPAERFGAWATALFSSAALFGALNLILYQGAREYYRHLGVTPEQAGLSQYSLAGGVLEFALLLGGLFLPGGLVAVTLFRWRTILAVALFRWGIRTPTMIRWSPRTRKIVDRLARLLTVEGVASFLSYAMLVIALLLIVLMPKLQHSTGSLLLVLVVFSLPVGFAGAGIFAVMYQSRWFRRLVRAIVALWIRHWRAICAALLVLLTLMLWGAADIAGSDVRRRGESNEVFPLSIQIVPSVPVLDLLGVRPESVSPCLIQVDGYTTQEMLSHLRAAVIAGQSGGRTYLVGVAGLAGFRGVSVGHVVRFSIADSDLRAVNLDKTYFDPTASPWNTIPQPIPADKMTC